MFSKKIILTTMTIITGCALSFAANSAPKDLGYHSLKIINHTSSDSTAVINGGACSDSLPNGKGITHPGQENEIDGNLLFIACGFSTSCSATVYASAVCSGNGQYPIVAVAQYDLNAGLQSFDVKDSRYKIIRDANNPFKIEVVGP